MRKVLYYVPTPALPEQVLWVYSQPCREQSTPKISEREGINIIEPHSYFFNIFLRECLHILSVT